MVLDPVSCLAEIHCTTVFALRNGKFSRLAASSLPHRENIICVVSVEQRQNQEKYPLITFMPSKCCQEIGFRIIRPEQQAAVNAVFASLDG